MIGELHYEPVGLQHSDRAVDLVLTAYEGERAHLPDLPEGSAFRSSLKCAIDGLLRRGCGLAAIDGNGLKGFIAGYEDDSLFGACQGVYIPVFGHAATGETDRDRVRLYEELYTRAADMWVRASRVSHAITLFAHDHLAVDTWFWLGFGLRCVDSIRTATPIETLSRRVTVKKACIDDVASITAIHATHMQYYRSSPVFMPTEIGDPAEDLAKWMTEPDHHLWIAFADGCTAEALGYIRIEPKGMSFVSAHPSAMNITGAYVAEGARGEGIGTALLAAIQEWLSSNGYRFCGVDFESINAVGSRFWNRYFTPYTYSVVRRIDERIQRYL